MVTAIIFMSRPVTSFVIGLSNYVQVKKLWIQKGVTLKFISLIHKCYEDNGSYNRLEW